MRLVQFSHLSLFLLNFHYATVHSDTAYLVSAYLATARLDSHGDTPMHAATSAGKGEKRQTFWLNKIISSSFPLTLPLLPSPLLFCLPSLPPHSLPISCHHPVPIPPRLGAAGCLELLIVAANGEVDLRNEMMMLPAHLARYDTTCHSHTYRHHFIVFTVAVTRNIFFYLWQQCHLLH